MITGCQAAYDSRRAQEWTTALTRWCEAQPDMVSFSGTCLVHRAEIMQLHGAWSSALDEARRAGERCAQASNRAWPRPCTGRESSTCGVSSPRPTRPTGARAGEDWSRSLA